MSACNRQRDKDGANYGHCSDQDDAKENHARTNLVAEEHGSGFARPSERLAGGGPEGAYGPGDNLGRGGRDLLKDVRKLVRDARRDTGRLNKALIADMNQLQKSVTGRAGRSQASQKSRTTRKTATRKAASGRTASTRSSKSTASRRAAK